jgi:hypothetical protein
MATPVWLGATAGYQGLAGQVNQFVGSHTTQWLYTGNQQANETTGDSIYQSTEELYLAQVFTTGASQTTVGRVLLQISTVGGSPVNNTIDNLTVSLVSSSFNAPSATVLAQTSLLETYVYMQPFWVEVPLLATGLTASTPYWLVVSTAGSPSAYYVWQQSNQANGCSTAPDGVTWSPQAFGLMYQVFDASANPNSVIQGFSEDGGARTVAFTWTSGYLTGLVETTQTQGGGSLTSSRTITYSNGQIIGVN